MRMGSGCSSMVKLYNLLSVSAGQHYSYCPASSREKIVGPKIFQSGLGDQLVMMGIIKVSFEDVQITIAILFACTRLLAAKCCVCFIEPANKM